MRSASPGILDKLKVNGEGKHRGEPVSITCVKFNVWIGRPRTFLTFYNSAQLIHRINYVAE